MNLLNYDKYVLKIAQLLSITNYDIRKIIKFTVVLI